jgi:hypothetical protein
MGRERPTQLVRDLHRLNARLSAVLEEHRGNGLRRDLYLELIGVLNGTRRFDEIPRHVTNSGALTERIARRLADHAGHALARAVYECTFYGVSIDHFVAQKEIHRSEWNYLSRLARSLNVPPSFGQDRVEEPPPWMIDVDESHQILRVWIRELALQDMLLAGMEAYLVPAGSGKPSTEIYGTVFGSYRVSPQPRPRLRRMSLVDLNVERICIQHRAQGSPSEVRIDDRSEVTQLAMGEELFPFWHLLGDFHTHTYRTLAELTTRHGWRYSDYDEKVNIDWCRRLRDKGLRPRVALILSITRAGRIGNGSQENWNGLPNVLRATIGKCHCFISAYRIRPDGRYSEEAVTLKCPHLIGQ